MGGRVKDLKWKTGSIPELVDLQIDSFALFEIIRRNSGQIEPAAIADEGNKKDKCKHDVHAWLKNNEMK